MEHPIVRRRPRRLPAPVYASGEVFSVTICTRLRESVFDDLSFGHECIELLLTTSQRYDAAVFAHCLMPDHVHLLLATGRGSLSSFVREWKSLCSRARRHRGQAEQFWQRGFWDHALRAEEGLFATALYILYNPVRAGLVDNWREYELSGSTIWNL